MREIRRLARNNLSKKTLEALTETMTQAVDTLPSYEPCTSLAGILSMSLDFIQDNQENYDADVVFELGLRATGKLPELLQAMVNSLTLLKETPTTDYYEGSDGHFYKLESVDKKPQISEIELDSIPYLEEFEYKGNGLKIVRFTQHLHALTIINEAEVGDYLIFLIDEDPTNGSPEWVTTSLREAIEWVDCYDPDESYDEED